MTFTISKNRDSEVIEGDQSSRSQVVSLVGVSSESLLARMSHAEPGAQDGFAEPAIDRTAQAVRVVAERIEDRGCSQRCAERDERVRLHVERHGHGFDIGVVPVVDRLDGGASVLVVAVDVELPGPEADDGVLEGVGPDCFRLEQAVEIFEPPPVLLGPLALQQGDVAAVDHDVGIPVRVIIVDGHEGFARRLVGAHHRGQRLAPVDQRLEDAHVRYMVTVECDVPRVGRFDGQGLFERVLETFDGSVELAQGIVDPPAPVVGPQLAQPRETAVVL